MFRSLVPLVAAGVVLAACGSGGSDDAAATTAAPPAAPSAPDTEPEGSAVVGAPPALQFSAPLIGGGDIELTTLAGRPVLLWFWAPW